MNPLSSFLNLFRQKPNTSTEANKKWRQGFHAFEAGKKLCAERRDQEAVDSFDCAVECGFENAQLFSSRGTCLQALEWHLDAIDDFSKAIALEPEDCNNYFQRAMSKSGTGDSEGFLADMETAIRLSKVDSSLNRNYDLGAKDMGWSSTASMYEGQAARSADWPDFIMERNIQRTKLRGRRKDKIR